jgi:hypothetical protein
MEEIHDSSVQTLPFTFLHLYMVKFVNAESLPNVTYYKILGIKTLMGRTTPPSHLDSRKFLSNETNFQLWFQSSAVDHRPTEACSVNFSAARYYLPQFPVGTKTHRFASTLRRLYSLYRTSV